MDQYEETIAPRGIKLNQALERLWEQGVNLNTVYEVLERAKNANFKATLESHELKFMQDLMEERTRIRKELTKWAKKAIKLHGRVFTEAGIDPRHWTQPYEDLLNAVNRDYLFKEVYRVYLFPPSSIWQDGKYRRAHAGGPSKGWLKDAERELAQAGVSKTLREELLKATKLRATGRIRVPRSDQ
jgi:hypothetical protein